MLFVLGVIFLKWFERQKLNVKGSSFDLFPALQGSFIFLFRFKKIVLLPIDRIVYNVDGNILK